MALPTHALKCEHDLHPRYCAICRARARALAEQGPVRASRRPPEPPPRPHEGPMPPWFRALAAASIAEAQAAATPTAQPALDLED